MRTRSTPDLWLEFKGYRLTTVEIIYCLPDYPEILQVFTWQTLDVPPEFPRLKAFLWFWEKNIEAKILSVKIAQSSSIQRSEVSFAKGEFHLCRKH